MVLRHFVGLFAETVFYLKEYIYCLSNNMLEFTCTDE